MLVYDRAVSGTRALPFRRRQQPAEPEPILLEHICQHALRRPGEEAHPSGGKNDSVLMQISEAHRNRVQLRR